MNAAALLASLGIDLEAVLASEDLGADTGAAVYLSGSLVEGLGNSSSDVDIFVVGDLVPNGPHVITKDKFCISIHFSGARRIDFEYWAAGHIKDMAVKLEAIRLGEDFVAEKLAPIEELFIHRILIGLPILGADRFFSLAQLFDRDRFRQYLVQQSIHRIDGAMEDVVGTIDDGDWLSAVTRSRDLVNFAADAFCHSKGNTNPLPKWRARILERLPGNEARMLEKQYWELQFPELGSAPFRAEVAEVYARRCLDFAEQITWSIQDDDR